jgi:hypothetical protein
MLRRSTQRAGILMPLLRDALVENKYHGVVSSRSAPFLSWLSTKELFATVIPYLRALLEASDRHTIISRSSGGRDCNLPISTEIRQLLSNMFVDSNNFDRYHGLTGAMLEISQTVDRDGNRALFNSGIHSSFDSNQIFDESKSKEVVIQTSNEYDNSDILEEDDIEEF